MNWPFFELIMINLTSMCSYLMKNSIFQRWMAPSGSYRIGSSGQKKIIPTDLERGQSN
jgi:hypothetical protein